MNNDGSKLRDTMGRHLDGLQPTTPIEQIRRKAHRGRLLVGTSLVATIALIGASGAFALQRFGNDRVIGPAGAPDCDGAPRAALEHPFVPSTTSEGGRTVLPITFPDGTTAELTYPKSLDLARMGVTSTIAMRTSGEQGTLVELGAGPPEGSVFRDEEPVDCFEGPYGRVEIWPAAFGTKDDVFARFPLDPWTATVVFGNPGQPPLDDIATWSNGLRKQIRGGWITLGVRNDLRFGWDFGEKVPTHETHLQIGDINPRGVLLWPNKCDDHDPPQKLHPNQQLASWCDRSGMEVHVWSDGPDFIRDVRDGLDVRAVEPRFPLNRYGGPWSRPSL